MFTVKQKSRGGDKHKIIKKLHQNQYFGVISFLDLLTALSFTGDSYDIHEQKISLRLITVILYSGIN
jgi:hypothetical protein